MWWVLCSGNCSRRDRFIGGAKSCHIQLDSRPPLSNFEAGLEYDNVSDPAVVVAFTLVDDPKTSLLAWTTTPWTLPSNLALCVNPEFKYVKVYDEERGQNFILLEKLLSSVYGDEKKQAKKDKGKDAKPKYKKVGEFLGKEMLGWRYVPLFNYFTDRVSPRNKLLRDSIFLSMILASSKTKHSAFSMMRMSVTAMVQASYTKHPVSVKTIIAFALRMVCLQLMMNHHVL